MKLVSTTDFVLNQDHLVQTAQKDHGSAYGAIFKYAEFLKQPLELWMFVPCGEDGLPLTRVELMYDQVKAQAGYSKAIDKREKAKKAEERVLFQDWGNWFDNNASLLLDVCLDMDSLVLYEVTLTPNAIKQLGL
ncbi:MAG: hypothetical protein COA88_14560 [Kordia sp.]|nr:MAG: hypothetical protein COA88_14560 [Kordia sp.]